MLGPDGQWYTAQPYLPRTNLVPNPSFRSADSTLVVRTNLCANPRAAVSTNGWRANNTSAHTVTFDTTFGRSGTTSAKSTPTGASIGVTRALGSIYALGGDTMSAAANGVYTISCYVAHNAAVPGEAQIQYSFRDNANTVLASANSPFVTGIPGDKSWTRVSITTPAAPAGTTKILIIGIVQTQSGQRTVVAGESCWFTDGLVEIAGGALPYFDGSTPADADTGWTYSWRSGVNASSSDWTAPVPALLAGNFGAYQSNRGGRTKAGDVLRVIQLGATPQTIYAYQPSADIVANPGDFFTGRWQARVVSGVAITVSPRLGFYSSAGSFLANAGSGANTTLPADGSWVDLTVPAQLAAPATTASVRLMLYSVGNNTTPGTTIELRRSLVEKAPAATTTVGSYFDGATAADPDYRYAWAGTANASPSVATP